MKAIVKYAITQMLTLVIVVSAAIFSSNAQVKVTSSHPDLAIKIKQTNYANGVLVVDLLLTNFSTDATIHFYGSGIYAPSTMAVDDEGNQYKEKDKILIGSSEKLTYDKYSIELMQDVPTKFRVQIQGVDPNATELAILKLTGMCTKFGMNYNKNPIIIRNLEWIK